MQGLANQSINVMRKRYSAKRSFSRGKKRFTRSPKGRRKGGYRKTSRSYYVSRGGIRL